MNKKNVAGAVYFQECLDELSSTQFDAVVRHLRNAKGVNFARYPKPRDVARKLAKHEEGAEMLTGAISEIEQADKVLEEMARTDADRALERLEDLGELED